MQSPAGQVDAKIAHVDPRRSQVFDLFFHEAIGVIMQSRQVAVHVHARDKGGQARCVCDHFESDLDRSIGIVHETKHTFKPFVLRESVDEPEDAEGFAQERSCDGVERPFVVLLLEQDIVVVIGQNLVGVESVVAQTFVGHLPTFLYPRGVKVDPLVLVGPQTEVSALQ